MRIFWILQVSQISFRQWEIEPSQRWVLMALIPRNPRHYITSVGIANVWAFQAQKSQILRFLAPICMTCLKCANTFAGQLLELFDPFRVSLSKFLDSGGQKYAQNSLPEAPDRNFWRYLRINLSTRNFDRGLVEYLGLFSAQHYTKDFEWALDQKRVKADKILKTWLYSLTHIGKLKILMKIRFFDQKSIFTKFIELWVEPHKWAFEVSVVFHLPYPLGFEIWHKLGGNSSIFCWNPYKHFQNTFNQGGNLKYPH